MASIHAEDARKPLDEPNILFIFADDWGWGDMSLHKSPYLRTESALVDKEKDVFLNRYRRTPPNAVRFRGKFYKVFNDKSTWHQAKAKCEQMGGRLAVVDNPAVNDFLVTELEKSNLADAFLGATDEAREGEWLWVTDTKLSFNNWGVWELKNQKNREPNNHTGNEHYLLLVAVMKDRPEWRGKWADVPDSPGAAFICQWD